jgi:hypothetical protein
VIVFRSVTDPGARLRSIDCRGDARAEKATDQMSDSYSHPRFPGKSKAYVDAYHAYEARTAPAATRTNAAPHRDAVENRADAEVYAAHEARMRRVYTDSFESCDDVSDADLHADAVENRTDVEAYAAHEARMRSFYIGGVP